MKIFNIYFDRVIETIQNYGDLDMDFYKSKHWPSRPNSTARLNLINYQALNLLSDEVDIENYVVKEFDENIRESFLSCDYVIIHQNASKKTFSILRMILDYIATIDCKAKIIFGTEGTWSSTKEFLEESHISEIYKKHTLLRHTAKTDREFYTDEDCLDINVKEFELGIDTNLLSSGKMVNSRKYISFVAAPEGRITKNNDLIVDIKNKIEKSGLDYEIKVLTPPYSSEEYWEVMSNSAFFIFTSDSETFSYCLNDAKALGAITFFPTHMYCTKIGARFVVDNYMDSSIRFSNIDEILEKISYFTDNKSEMAMESFRSRQYVLDHHSIEAVSKNWRNLLLGGETSKRNLYIYDRSRDSRSLEDIKSYCSEINAVMAMPYMNNDEVAWRDDRFFANDNGFIFPKYYLSIVSSRIKRAFYLNEDSKFRFGEGALAGVEKKSELIPFLSLIKRINKIDSIIIDESIFSQELSDAVDLIG